MINLMQFKVATDRLHASIARAFMMMVMMISPRILFFLSNTLQFCHSSDAFMMMVMMVENGEDDIAHLILKQDIANLADN